MLRRPQRTEAAQLLEARTARTFAAPLRAGVSKTVAQRAAKRKPLRLEREHGAYRRRVRPQHGEQTSQRHGACGVAMHAACARCRCRRAVAVSTGRACASGALRKPVAGTARGGSERCFMQRSEQQRSVRGDVRSEMTALWRCLITTCRRVSCNRMLDGCVSQSSSGAMLDDHMSSSDPEMGCLTTPCRRVSCQQLSRWKCNRLVARTHFHRDSSMALQSSST